MLSVSLDLKPTWHVVNTRYYVLANMQAPKEDVKPSQTYVNMYLPNSPPNNYITYLVRTNLYFCLFRWPFFWVSVLLISIFTTAMRCKPRSAVFIIKVDQVAIIFVFCIKNFSKNPKWQRAVDGPDLCWTKSKVETQIIFTATNWRKTWQCPDPSGFEPRFTGDEL